MVRKTEEGMGWKARGRCALGCLSAWIFAGGTVHAGETSGHVTWSASVRYSDNVLGVPPPGENRPIGLPLPVSDVGIQFSPGVALVHVGSRASWALSYSHPILLYVRHPLAHSSGDVVAWIGTFLPGPLDVVDAEASVARFNSTLTSLVEPITEREITAVRAAATTLVRSQAAIRHRHEYSLAWSSYLEARSTLAVPLEDGAGLLATDGALGARWAHEANAFGVGATLLHAVRLRERPLVGSLLPDQALVVGPEMRWTRDWSQHWSSVATAGVVAPVLGADGMTVRPVGSVSLGYDRDVASLTLEWRRAYTPSPLTGQVFFADTYSLRGRTPIVAEWNLDATSGTGLARSRILDGTTGNDTDRVTTWLVDVAVGWTPPRSPRFTVGYQWTHQRGADPSQALLPSFDRHVASVGVEFAFPPPPLLDFRGGMRRVDSRERPPLR